jgi:hypothetical protein
MFSQGAQIGQKKLTPEAETRARELASDYLLTLTVQAKTLAYSRRDDVVLPNHIDEARVVLRTQPRPRTWQMDILSPLEAPSLVPACKVLLVNSAARRNQIQGSL